MTSTETEHFNLLVKRVAELEAQLAFLYRHLGLTPPAQAGEAMQEVMAMVMQGNRIAAIAKYRELTGVGLAEAKAAVDELAARKGFV